MQMQLQLTPQANFWSFLGAKWHENSSFYENIVEYW
jgi:hypothetical protein